MINHVIKKICIKDIFINYLTIKYSKHIYEDIASMQTYHVLTVYLHVNGNIPVYLSQMKMRGQHRKNIGVEWFQFTLQSEI